jgi:hypothetical protein
MNYEDTQLTIWRVLVGCTIAVAWFSVVFSLLAL